MWESLLGTVFEAENLSPTFLHGYNQENRNEGGDKNIDVDYVH